MEFVDLAMLGVIRRTVARCDNSWVIPCSDYRYVSIFEQSLSTVCTEMGPSSLLYLANGPCLQTDPHWRDAQPTRQLGAFIPIGNCSYEHFLHYRNHLSHHSNQWLEKVAGDLPRADGNPR